jgi:hypothetical protein
VIKISLKFHKNNNVPWIKNLFAKLFKNQSDYYSNNSYNNSKYPAIKKALFYKACPKLNIIHKMLVKNKFKHLIILQIVKLFHQRAIIIKMITIKF